MTQSLKSSLIAFGMTICFVLREVKVWAAKPPKFLPPPFPFASVIPNPAFLRGEDSYILTLLRIHNLYKS